MVRKRSYSTEFVLLKYYKVLIYFSNGLLSNVVLTNLLNCSMIFFAQFSVVPRIFNRLRLLKSFLVCCRLVLHSCKFRKSFKERNKYFISFHLVQTNFYKNTQKFVGRSFFSVQKLRMRLIPPSTLLLSIQSSWNSIVYNMAGDGISLENTISIATLWRWLMILWHVCS